VAGHRHRRAGGLGYACIKLTLLHYYAKSIAHLVAPNVDPGQSREAPAGA